MDFCAQAAARTWEYLQLLGLMAGTIEVVPRAREYLRLLRKALLSREELTELENAMVTIMRVFHLYSGYQCKLKKADLSMLINKELPQFIQEIHDPQVLDQLIADLDINGDSEIDFQEYSTLIAMVTAACQQFFSQKESQ
ncbi:protein S100-B-like [Microcaecilia unicolor]|uniref:Protein S100-B-like n=1 Tax=Microcaecilia unicolor TaxID=1415580 RepID=A0A6P7XDF8_9AMPH|nr:protein S100-B-like [Microcaecilia unicolor]